MKMHVRGGRRPMVAAVVLTALVVLLAATGGSAAAGGRPNVIIGYSGSDTAARSLVAKHGGSVSHQFGAINALAASLDSARVADLARDGGVRYVENDAPRTAMGLSDLANTQLVPDASNGLYGLVMTN